MQIAVVGAGAIGTFFAYLFAREGHDVTLVARGARLAALSSGRVLVRSRGRRDEAAVSASDTLDPDRPWDLVLVAVRRQQADEALVATVSATKARRVMFMFNTARELAPLREAVGRERFLWGFPAVVARLEEDVLVYSVVSGALRFAQITTLGGMPGEVPPGLAEVEALFHATRLPIAVSADMPAWLKTHAAFMMPLMAAGLLRGERRLAWRDARLVAAAMSEAFALVRATGARITPRAMVLLGRVPARLLAAVLYVAFRFGKLHEALRSPHARGELGALLDDLRALAPAGAPPPLGALRERLAAVSS